jgi:two-component system, NarL family, nitrate/nitrite response regulator NarL
MNTPPAKPIGVMLISDLKIVSWGLERLIQSAYPRLELAGTFIDCEELSQALAATPVDVILLDLDGSMGSETISTLCAMSSAKVLALAGADDKAQCDSVVVAGARGIVGKRESVETLVKAIEKVHEGELWIDRAATGRIFEQLSQNKNTSYKSPDQKKIGTLTKRELQTVAEITTDASATGKVIAQRLNISENTLRNHLNSIYAKLGLSSRLELFLYAKRHTMPGKT